MRVIAGTARGIDLDALPGEEITRPTINRVKEAMFSALQFSLPGAQVLDLFGGSGQLGIEALSRGAARCTFIDRNQDAARVIINNCKKAKVFDRSRVNVAEAEHFLTHTKETYHIVLLDPPYRMGLLQKLLPFVEAVTAPGGSVVCESELECVMPVECGGLKMVKQHHYGKVLVTRYEKQAAEIE